MCKRSKRVSVPPLTSVSYDLKTRTRTRIYSTAENGEMFIGINDNHDEFISCASAKLSTNTSEHNNV